MGFLGKSEKQEAQKPNAVAATANAPKAKTEEKKPKGLSQKDAVFQEVQHVVKARNITVTKGKPVGELLGKEHRKEIVDALVSGFKSKKYPLKDSEGNRKKLSDDTLLRIYATGLLKNWLERDKRLQNANGEFSQS